MTISMLLAWGAVICGFLTVFKYFARISGSKEDNIFFHRIHIPCGILLLVLGLLHGLLAGNLSGTSLSELSLGELLFTLNAGSLCFLISCLLALTYVFRRRLKKRWMSLHRVLTVLFLLVLFLHLREVGINLPKQLFGSRGSSASVTTTSAGSSQTTAASSGASSASTEEIKDSLNSDPTLSERILKDGSFEGEAQGFQSTIRVRLTIKDNRIDSLEILEAGDTPKYFSRAQALIDRVLGNQSPEVDVVTGATFSSVGILNAIKNALNQAIEEGAPFELQALPSGGKRH